ncbi:VWA domain-containing protein [Tuwongella immobilis]|uniref:VWFA domain-containing protein n=1 Tax=Tuwongella immobilis TaxID=692036 RepID=A0A6C2YSW9_9BACT|nr:VWA domain-containing protein [Tuwongella immobilis]VIP04233.1 Putative uncharacterized protein OS=Arthrospira sp. PCC 8005 GN=ARTHRO_560017 PE=4 SV=1 [Tuwongella immobilis]VTS05830.1 Putative uncharacterized protein OS=Arthrospira sp. PCC 8005 GN=ARTHRO_560017 PE=4 SV=1 [Tuwongella immobilis]
MTQLARPVEPFGEVNVFRETDGRLRVVATVLMEPDIEGAKAGLALDASASMKKIYGANAPVSPLFAKAAGVTNIVEPVARTMASYLARFASSGRVTLAYWACDSDGSKVEPIGEFNDDQTQTIDIRGPRKFPWGRNTRLLPPVKYFIEQVFVNCPWAIGVFVTDGEIADLAEVKAYSLDFAKAIAKGDRSFVKLVLLGVGEEVRQSQLAELDDMFDGSDLRDPKGEPIDLWDHKLVSEMKSLTEIFAEVISEHVILAESGQVLDHRHQVVHHYTDGVPGRLEFFLPGDATEFTLKLPHLAIVQDLTEGLSQIGTGD